MRSNLSLSRRLKERIFILREEGSSYNKIAEELTCSKGTISYHLGVDQKNKTNVRSQKTNWRKVWDFAYNGKQRDSLIGYSKTTTTPLNKKGRNFLYGKKKKGQYMEMKALLKNKNTKIFNCLDKIWPGINKDNQRLPAVDQWSGEPSYDDEGKILITPFVRCKLTNRILNAQDNFTEVDHIDGQRNNNDASNFSFVQRQANAIKQQLNYKDLLVELKLVVANLEKNQKYFEKN